MHNKKTKINCRIKKVLAVLLPTEQNEVRLKKQLIVVECSLFFKLFKGLHVARIRVQIGGTS